MGYECLGSRRFEPGGLARLGPLSLEASCLGGAWSHSLSSFLSLSFQEQRGRCSSCVSLTASPAPAFLEGAICSVCSENLKNKPRSGGAMAGTFWRLLG